MKKLLCLAALGLALAPSARARQRDAPAPAAPCDEAAQAARYNLLFRGNFRGEVEQRKGAYEAAKEFLRCCAEGADPERCRISPYVANWVEKYDAAVRRFEAGRDGGALGLAAGEGMTKGLTQPQ